MAKRIFVPGRLTVREGGDILDAKILRKLNC